MSAARARAMPKVADLDRARLDRLLEERARAVRQIAAVDERIAALCRAWSDAHGYRVVLRPEQVKRAMDASVEKEDENG